MSVTKDIEKLQENTNDLILEFHKELFEFTDEIKEIFISEKLSISLIKDRMMKIDNLKNNINNCKSSLKNIYEIYTLLNELLIEQINNKGE